MDGTLDRARLLQGLAAEPRHCRHEALTACRFTPASDTRHAWRGPHLAKEFSPRVQRYGSDCVVLDVSGLGRLLGDPQTIGSELDDLHRALADR